MNQHLNVLSASHNVYESSRGGTVISVLVVCTPWRNEDEEEEVGGDGEEDGE